MKKLFIIPTVLALLLPSCNNEVHSLDNLDTEEMVKSNLKSSAEAFFGYFKEVRNLKGKDFFGLIGYNGNIGGDELYKNISNSGIFDMPKFNRLANVFQKDLIKLRNTIGVEESSKLVLYYAKETFAKKDKELILSRNLTLPCHTEYENAMGAALTFWVGCTAWTSITSGGIGSIGCILTFAATAFWIQEEYEDCLCETWGDC